jgi:type IV secretion system protein VirD4
MVSNQTSVLYRLPQRRSIALSSWRSTVLGLAMIVVVSAVATQYLAFEFREDPALGHVVASIAGYAFYEPWAWAIWQWRWSMHAEGGAAAAFTHSSYIILAGAAVSFLVVGVYRRHTIATISRDVDHIHGSARWAERDDLVKAAVVPRRQPPRASVQADGVYIGGWFDAKYGVTRYLRHTGPEHVLAFAPTRSGKGVGLVIPTLLTCRRSAVVHDIKGELHALTSGYRASMGQRCIRFDPASPDNSDRFNPLAEIRLKTIYEVGDVQNIVTMIVDPDGKGLNDHWDKTGHALLTGALLHLLYVAARDGKPTPCLADVADFLSNPDEPIQDSLEAMMSIVHDQSMDWSWSTELALGTKPGDYPAGKSSTHPVVAACARAMLNKAPNERSGVLSTALSFLELYRDPVIRRNTSKSDFRIGDLVNEPQPVTLYLVVGPEDKIRLKPLTRLIISQVIRTLTRTMKFENGEQVNTHRHKLLLMLDEFTALGRMDILEESLAFVAGYGLLVYLIIQDLQQLTKHYGQHEAITGNCHVQIAYAPRRFETAEYLSKMTGNMTVVKTSVTHNGDSIGLGRRSFSESLQETSRALLTPDEFLRLPAPIKDDAGRITAPGDMVIFLAGQFPIYGRQILHFQDPTFNERSRLPATGIKHVPLSTGSITRRSGAAGRRITRAVNWVLGR